MSKRDNIFSEQLGAPSQIIIQCFPETTTTARTSAIATCTQFFFFRQPYACNLFQQCSDNYISSMVSGQKEVHARQNKLSRNICKRKTAQQTTTHISVCGEPTDERKSKIKLKGNSSRRRAVYASMNIMHAKKTRQPFQCMHDIFVGIRRANQLWIIRKFSRVPIFLALPVHTARKQKLRQESNARRCGEGIQFQQTGGHDVRNGRPRNHWRRVESCSPHRCCAWIFQAFSTYIVAKKIEK